MAEHTPGTNRLLNSLEYSVIGILARRDEGMTASSIGAAKRPPVRDADGVREIAAALTSLQGRGLAFKNGPKWVTTGAGLLALDEYDAQWKGRGSPGAGPGPSGGGGHEGHG